MPVEATVGKKTYPSNNNNHAEEVMFNTGKYETGDFTVELDAWPCVDEGFHNCHQKFIDKSHGRTITVIVNDDHGGYAKNHGFDFGAMGTITYDRGNVTYS
ncbi:MAG: hypothetical protein ACSHW7_11500 [Patiriisocius sp.]|uniref:hypothetical protein n=1 Tax=Patiriisocius sp. TaxID=2822396 RepID=UPI003EF13839